MDNMLIILIATLALEYTIFVMALSLHVRLSELERKLLNPLVPSPRPAIAGAKR